MTSCPYDVVVVGGGLIGAAAALGLGRLGRRTLLVERQQPKIPEGRFGLDIRNVTLSPGSRKLLADLGVWAALEPAVFRGMCVWEDQGTREIRFSAAEVGRSELGWILENGPTVAALWNALELNPEVDVLRNADLQRLDAQADCVSLETTAGVCAGRLVIGVDGARSTVRKLVGAGLTEYPTGQSALATLVRTQRPHEGIAYQRFLRDGPLAWLPSRDPRVVSVVWSQSTAAAHSRRELPEDSFCREICAAMEQRLGAVELVDQRIVFPLQQQLVDRFDPVPRVLLIGDAARQMHPLAGLGANVGFEDVRDLLSRFRVLPAAVDPGGEDIWRKFARQRRSRSRFMLGLMSGLRRVYAQDDPFLQWLRNAGVKLTNQTLPLKRQFIREALGLGG